MYSTLAIAPSTSNAILPLSLFVTLSFEQAITRNREDSIRSKIEKDAGWLGCLGYAGEGTICSGGSHETKSFGQMHANEMVRKLQDKVSTLSRAQGKKKSRVREWKWRRTKG